MSHAARFRCASLAALFLMAACPVFAQNVAPSNIPAADPSEPEIEAVLGAQTQVKRLSPGMYAIDGEETSLQQLLTIVLPHKEETLKTMQGNIDQRLSIQNQAASGISLDMKRAQCQKLAFNSIDRTRCYQELEGMRDQASESVESVADQRKDDQLQRDRLQQDIDAIDRFRQQYGPR